MKKLLVVLLLIFQQGYAQKNALLPIDSLLQQLPRLHEDTLKLSTLKKIAKAYQQTNLDNSLSFGQQGLTLAFKLKNIKYICGFYDLLGETYTYKGDYKSSLEQYNKQYNIAVKYKDKHFMATPYNDIGLVYEYQGDYTDAQTNFFKCLKIAEQNDDYRLQQVSQLNISAVYINQNNFEEAMKYAQNAFESIYKNHSKESALLGKAYELMGSSSVVAKKYNDAQNYYNKAIALYMATKNEIGIASMYSLMLSAYPKDYKKQLEYGFKAQAIWDKKAPQNLYAISNLGNIGIAYGDMVRQRIAISKNDLSPTDKALLSKSQDYLSKAVKLAKETDTKQSIVDLGDSLSVIQAMLGNYKDAYINLKTRNSIADSIFSQASKNKIASLEGQHEIELRDKELQINKLEIVAQQKQRWFFIAGMGMLVLIALSILYQSKQRKKANLALLQANKQLDEANKIKTRFFSILNHDLRSPIANFVNFLHLQQDSPDLLSRAVGSDYTQLAAASAERLLTTMEDLLLWSKGQMENFKPAFKNIVAADLFSYIGQSVSIDSEIRVSFAGDIETILYTDEHYIKTIMHNLTNNAMKVLAGITNAHIEWEAGNTDGIKYLKITDNGRGAKQDMFKALYDDSAPIGIQSGLGLHIVRDMAKSIGCEIEVHINQEHGVEVKLYFR